MVATTNHQRNLVQTMCFVLGIALVTGCSYAHTKDDYYAIATKPEHKLVSSELKTLENEAKKGNPTAIYKLSKRVYFENNYKDSPSSFEWKEKAARAGSKAAMLGTGYAYLDGRGTTINIEKALYWLILESKLSNEGDLFSRDAINEASAKLALEQQEQIRGQVNRDIEGYRKRWQNFCKEYDKDPMC